MEHTNSAIKVYVVVDELKFWDNTNKYYHTTTSAPRVCRTLDEANEIAKMKFDITNRANCHGLMKFYNKWESEDKNLRATYYEDDNKDYKYEVSIWEQTL